MNKNLVILAGGISSRMKNSALENIKLEKDLIEEARYKSKSMINIGNEPFLNFLLLNISRAEYEDIVMVVNENDLSIRDYYERNYTKFKGINLSYVVQPIPAGRKKPLGTSDALLRVLETRTDWKNQKFTVCNSDNLYSTEAFSILLNSIYENAFIEYDRNALKFSEKRINSFGLTVKDSENYLIDIIEKPTPFDLKTSHKRKET
jgi:glucose-1-phosphate adenylyltransferase